MRPHYDKHRKNPNLEKIQDRVEEPVEALSEPTSPRTVSPQVTAPPVATIRPQTVTNNSPSHASQSQRSTGYESYEAEKCPRENCPLSKQSHFHCTKAECQYATENMELMLDHKTNEKLIFDSFKQCSRKVDCQRPGCKYNMLHKHFHCMHQGCHFSFLQVRMISCHSNRHGFKGKNSSLPLFLESSAESYISVLIAPTTIMMFLIINNGCGMNGEPRNYSA